MQVILDLPDWVQERHISIMAGMELVAYKPYQAPWMIKTVRCNNCGWCCENPPKGAVPVGPDGACVYLEAFGIKKECSLGLARPWHCCWPDPHLTRHPEAMEHCCIRYVEAGG
jgi:hypothetical protein